MLAAAAPTLALAQEGDGANDRTGLSTLGVDISGVANDPSAVHEFLAQRPVGGYPAVIGGCETALAGQQPTSGNVVDFCRIATGADHGVAMNAEANRTAY